MSIPFLVFGKRITKMMPQSSKRTVRPVVQEVVPVPRAIVKPIEIQKIQAIPIRFSVPEVKKQEPIQILKIETKSVPMVEAKPVIPVIAQSPVPESKKRKKNSGSFNESK